MDLLLIIQFILIFFENSEENQDKKAMNISLLILPGYRRY